MQKLLARFAKDESGATAIEYGLIAAGIAVVIITVVFSIGTTLEGKFTEINDKLNEAGGGGTTPPAGGS